MIHFLTENQKVLDVLADFPESCDDTLVGPNRYGLPVHVYLKADPYLFKYIEATLFNKSIGDGLVTEDSDVSLVEYMLLHSPKASTAWVIKKLTEKYREPKV